MRGHVRSRGESTPAAGSTSSTSAWRRRRGATSCNRRFWIERRPTESCPKCGGALRETEERRRETKAGFATQKECQAAMNKLLVAVEQHNYSAPTKANVQPVPDQGVAAGRQGHDPPQHLQLLRAARRVPHRAAHRLGEARQAHGSAR